MKKPSEFFIFIFSLFIFSCASESRLDTHAYYVYLADGKKFNIILPSISGVEMDEVQTVSGSFRNKKYFLNSFVKINKEETFVSFFNAVGAGIGELRYDGKNLEFYSPYADANTKGEYILADIQLAFYDSAVVKAQLERDGFNFQFEQDGKVEIRRIFNGNQLIIKIEKYGEKVFLENYLRNYSYELGGLK